MIQADDSAILGGLNNLPTPTQDLFPKDTRPLDEMLGGAAPRLDAPPPGYSLAAEDADRVFEGGKIVSDFAGDAVQELAAPGGPHAVGQALSAAVTRQQEVDNWNADTLMLSRAYQPVLEAINRDSPANDQLPNPYLRSQSYDFALKRFGPNGQTENTRLLEKEIWARVDQLRASNPGVAGNIPDSHEALLDDIAQEQRTALSWADLTASHGAASRVASFVGALAGGFVDPPNLLASAIGLPASESLLKTFLTEGAINTALDVAGLPGRAQRYARAGQPLSKEDIAAELIGDFLVGGAIPTGVKALSRAMRASASPDVMAAARVVEDAANRADANPHAGDAEGQDLMRQGALTAMNALNDGRPDLLPDTTAHLGRALDPAIEARRRRQGFAIESFDPAALGTDAAAMQYKGGGDAQGVTDRLAGVTEWDPVKAGLALVWERKDGTLVIADGHQRLGLARRLAEGGQEDVALYGSRFREADGYSAADMRVIAALKNIAEGSGTGIDAARLLRDAPEGWHSLPPRSPLVRQARDLAALSDDAFGMTVNGHASERDAAIVGRFVHQKDMQAPVLKVLAEHDPDTAEEAELFVRQALAAGASREVQSDMFGDFIKADLILPRRVKILKGALSSLRKDKALFSTLTERQSAIEAAGNRLDAAENAARGETAARAFATLKALAERKGPISDALQNAAEEAARSGNSRAATARFVQDVRDAVARGDLDRATPGGDVGDVEPAPADAGLSEGPGTDPALADSLSLFGDPVEKPEAFAQQSRDVARDLVNGFFDTRGGSERFHGTSGKIAALDNEHFESLNIYGNGFYTTDAADIAHGYSKKGRGGDPTLYRVEESRPLKMYDLDAPMPAEVRAIVDEQAKYSDLVELALADPVDVQKIESLRQLFDEARGFSRAEGLSADEVQESVFQPIMDEVERLGYDGFQHIGGLNTKKKPHAVKIYFNPADDLKLTEIKASELQPQEQAAPVQLPAAPASKADVAAAKPEFGPAQDEIEAIRRLDGDDVVPDPSGAGEVTVRELRRRMEREARAIESLRKCGGFDGEEG